MKNTEPTKNKIGSNQFQSFPLAFNKIVPPAAKMLCKDWRRMCCAKKDVVPIWLITVLLLTSSFQIAKLLSIKRIGAIQKQQFRSAVKLLLKFTPNMWIYGRCYCHSWVWQLMWLSLCCRAFVLLYPVSTWHYLPALAELSQFIKNPISNICWDIHWSKQIQNFWQIMFQVCVL